MNKKIKVARIPWTIKLVPLVTLLSDDDNEYFGVSKHKEKVIEVAEQGHPNHVNNVLCHEIIHAIVSEYRIAALHDEEGGHDESAVQQLAVGLNEVLTSLGIDLVAVIRGKK